MSDYLVARRLAAPAMAAEAALETLFDDASLVEAAIALDLDINRFLQGMSEDIYL